MAFEVDSGIADIPRSPEMLAMLGLYVLAGSWSSRAGEDGWVPETIIVERWDPDLEVTAMLVEQDLWLARSEVDGEAGYRFVVGDLCRFTTWRQPIPQALREAVYGRDDHRCLRCGTSERLSLDHIVPWSRGGPDTIDNLQTLCTPCNSRKGARLEGVS